jgi:hypothetical protein
MYLVPLLFNLSLLLVLHLLIVHLYISTSHFIEHYQIGVRCGTRSYASPDLVNVYPGAHHTGWLSHQWEIRADVTPRSLNLKRVAVPTTITLLVTNKVG